MPTIPSDEPAAQAHALLEQLFALMDGCRAVVPQLETAATDRQRSAPTPSASSLTRWSASSRPASSPRPRMRSPCCGRRASRSGRWAEWLKREEWYL